MRILEQGPAKAALVAAAPVVSKIKADDTRFANRGGRMSGVHAKRVVVTIGPVGRASRLNTESLHGGTITPVMGRGGNYKAK